MTLFDPLASEPTPRDFTARLHRRAIGVAMPKRRRHAGRRALALLAAFAVPAFAAPSEWRSFEVGDAGNAELKIEPLPFERQGDSFPGSAFYYLAPGNAPQVDDMGAHSDAETGSVGAAARSMLITGSGTDGTRALTCLTQAIYYEAASEPDDGQRAVAQVILNRVAHPAFPNTVCGVVYQGSERATGCQFSFTCDGALGRVPVRQFWLRAENVARAALAGYVYNGIGLSTHYHTIAVHPVWDKTMNLVQTIGAHQFFQLRGPAGSSQTFRFAYAGGEPVAAPRPRSNAPLGPDPSLDPLAIERAYAAGFKVAQDGAVSPVMGGLAPVRTAPAPNYAAEVQQRGGDRQYRGDKLPESQVNPEYRNSGKWIVQPGT